MAATRCCNNASGRGVAATLREDLEHVIFIAAR
jgi:hypothetical protein